VLRLDNQMGCWGKKEEKVTGLQYNYSIASWHLLVDILELSVALTAESLALKPFLVFTIVL